MKVDFIKSTDSEFTVYLAAVLFSNEYLAFSIADEFTDENLSLNIEYFVGGTTCKIGNPKYTLTEQFQRA